MTPAPPLTPLAALDGALTAQGFAVVSAADMHTLAGASAAQFAAWAPLWNDLASDDYLKDGGHYRRRRHGSFMVTRDSLHHVPHRAHWQSVSYNALHGGIERWFEPLPAALVNDPAWANLLMALAARADALRGADRWYTEAHLFRIDTTGGIGRPTPEGAHRDGVDLVAVSLVARQHIKGGETRVFDVAGPQGQRFTLAEPWSTLLLDDERVIHESTPIQPLTQLLIQQPIQPTMQDADTAAPAYRDTLVITLRRGGFQDPTPTLLPTSLPIAP